MSRDKVDLPEGLWGEVEERFGKAANSKSGIYAAALWYAIERYDAEHGGPPGPAADAQEDSDAEE